MTDFEFYQGDNVIPYFVITDESDAPVDLTAVTAATWVESSSSGTPVIIKHLDGMMIGVDAEVEGATVENCLYVYIDPDDTGTMADVGTFEHELRITISGMEAVVYPPVGATATFTVVRSLTWNPTATPPAPRLVEEPKEEPKEEPAHMLRRMPKMPGKEVTK